jgi:UDP-N-acetyl-D-mannosaminuronic acid dehydrogenase
MKKIAIIGIGRVGLPFALYLESLGFEVVGIDKDVSLIQSLAAKKMPFLEAGCQELLEKSKALFMTEMEKIREADGIVITVGTPLMPHIETDLSNVENVLRSLIPYLRRSQCVILRSTVAPKTTQYVRTFLESHANLAIGSDLGLAVCPERLSEHKALEELKKLPQIIGCEDNLSYEMAVEIFGKFKVKLLRTNYLSAELAKLFNNSARYIEFAIANQFAIYANNFHQNVYEILQLCNEDYPRAFPYKPGLTAGTCLRKDFGMINELSSGPDLLLAGWKINEYMPLHLVELASKYKPLTGARVAVLGYTFKKNSDDTRDSLVPKLIRYLERQVPRSILVCDPHLTNEKIGRHRNVDLKTSLQEADVVFIAIDHNEFCDKKTVLEALQPGAVVIDLWNCLKENRIVIQKEKT